MSIPGSALDRFFTGNLETFKAPDIDIIEELKKFYAKNYSSNLMNLVLVSRLSLAELEALATENFSQVENRELPVKDFTKEAVFDKEHTFGRICKIIPDKLIK